MIRAEFIRPLAGMQVAFLGKLRRLSRQEAETLATRLGGTCQGAVNESTDFLVVGSEEDATKCAAEGRNWLIAESQPPWAGGHSIKVISENEFLGLVTSPATTK